MYAIRSYYDTVRITPEGLPGSYAGASTVRINPDAQPIPADTGVGSCLRREPFPARPALRLDPDFDTAMKMMQRMEEIRSGLPGLDCGCCGAPNCQALAEDIVHGSGSREDCVIIMKEEYRELLEQKWQSGE